MTKKPEELRVLINDPAESPESRIESLVAYKATGEIKSGTRRGEVNNHVHTIFSFSPYTPEMTTVLAYETGLEAVGSVDHDSVAAARTFGQGGRIVGIGTTSGFEIRVRWTDPRFSGKKINYPDCLGRAYIVAHGIPQQSLEKAELYLKPIREARILRTRTMTQKLSPILEKAGFGNLDFDRDIVPLTQLERGGTVTERHLLGGVAKKIITFVAQPNESSQSNQPTQANQASQLTGTLTQELNKRLGIVPPAKVVGFLDDPENPHRYYDLLGVLKTTLLESVWIDPGPEECPPVQEATAFIRELGAIPAYAYLGDVGESPTGDKRAEFFEDTYLDDFFPSIRDMGFQAVTYMPPRNTKEQLLRVQKLCGQYQLMEISGVDINSSRQVFTCPEILDPQFQHLNTSTWALIAHEILVNQNLKWGLFHPENPLSPLSLSEKIQAYGRAGKRMDPHNPLEMPLPWNILQKGEIE